MWLLWHNLSLCHIQKEDYEAAKEDLGTLLTIAPKYTRAVSDARGTSSLKQNDTIQALRDFDKAIDMDRYDPDGWGQEPLYVSSRESIKRLKLIWTSLSI